MVMDSSEAWGEVIPLTETAKCNLSASEVYEYLTKAGNVYKESTCLCANPPVQPRGGSIFLSPDLWIFIPIGRVFIEQWQPLHDHNFLVWEEIYYDGMQNKGCHLIPFMEDQLNNNTGSYAYYFITH